GAKKDGITTALYGAPEYSQIAVATREFRPIALCRRRARGCQLPKPRHLRRDNPARWGATTEGLASSASAQLRIVPGYRQPTGARAEPADLGWKRLQNIGVEWRSAALAAQLGL